MTRKRASLFVGALVPENRGRGRPVSDTEKSRTVNMRRMLLLMELARAVMKGDAVTTAMTRVASEHHATIDALEKLWAVDREDALAQAAAELVSTGRLSPEQARERLATVLQDAANRRQRIARRTVPRQ